MNTLDQLAAMSPEARAALLTHLEAEIERTRAHRRLWSFYPDEGPLRRELYAKHLEFFKATATHDEVAAIAANRSGKTQAVCYASTLHLLGEYPPWWEGRRFGRPVTIWLCGEDTKAVRESLQEKMLGRHGNYGTGLVPGSNLAEVRPRVGVPESVDLFAVRHVSGGMSRCVFKAYEQGRESFQSAQVDVVVFDEEPPWDIYTEGLTRTLSTVPGERNGLIMCSFTPLKGLSQTVLQFLPGGVMPQTEEQRFVAWGW